MNKTGLTVLEVYVSPTRDDEWGEDVMGRDVLGDDEGVDVNQLAGGPRADRSLRRSELRRLTLAQLAGIISIAIGITFAGASP